MGNQDFFRTNLTKSRIQDPTACPGERRKERTLTSSSSAGPAFGTGWGEAVSLSRRHFQNFLFSRPCSPNFSSSTVTTASAALHPRSFLCRTQAAISADRDRSMTFENFPCQQNTWSRVTRTKQSPEFSD